MKNYPRNIIKYHLQYERQPFMLLWGVLLAFYWFMHLSVPSYPLAVTIRRLLISAASFILLRALCRSYLLLGISHVGKELRKYGGMWEIAKDVNEQYQRAIYKSRDQAITEKYLILLSNHGKFAASANAQEGLPPPNIHLLFSRECRLHLISTSEIYHVVIEDGNPYANEMNTLQFITEVSPPPRSADGVVSPPPKSADRVQNKCYSMTIYQGYQEVAQIKEKLEQCITLRKGPFSHNNDHKILQERNEARKKSKKPAWNSSGHTVQSCLSGRRKVFRGIMIAIAILLIGVFAFLTKMEDYTLSDYMRDIAAFPLESAILAAVYIVPPALIYIHIRRMERQVLRRYERLKYYEQQALDERIAREPAPRVGDVLYEPSCFWFRDWHNLCFQNLVLYEDVVWIYPGHAASDLSTDAISGTSSVMSWHAIIFYTKDGRKHSIFMGDYRRFAGHFQNVITGYGREQKRAYKSFLQESFHTRS